MARRCRTARRFYVAFAMFLAALTPSPGQGPARTPGITGRAERLALDSLNIEAKGAGAASRLSRPVSGGIPLPEGLLRQTDLPNLGLFDPEGTETTVQYRVNGWWPDGSIKWLNIDFIYDGKQAGGYRIRRLDRRRLTPRPVARKVGESVEVNTGPLRAVFSRNKWTLSRSDGKVWRTVLDGGARSRIVVKDRASGGTQECVLPIAAPLIEENGPVRCSLKIEDWHRSERSRFSKSVIRLDFYRGARVVGIHHTWVMTEDPRETLVSCVALDLPLTQPALSVQVPGDGPSPEAQTGARRIALLQRDLARPTFPPPYEFKPQWTFLDGDAVLAKGERCAGAMELDGADQVVRVFLRDMWQMLPKALVYTPEDRTLSVQLWPGNFVGDLDLRREEIKRPEHYRKFEENDKRLFLDKKYSPKRYVPHTLEHSAMGAAQTHDIFIEFAPPSDALPEELSGSLQPLVPFAGGEWNVATGVMGKQVLPGTFRPDLEQANRRMVDALLDWVERGGWYGAYKYGNVRYAYDKVKHRWRNYHPKYAWFNSEHCMDGGTLHQALWYQYLRTGDPRLYAFARARGRNKADVSVVHYHKEEKRVGCMIRHGGYDPWVGARRAFGAHAAMNGLPVHYYVTGDARVLDAVHLTGRTHYKHKDFNLGRNCATDINSMVIYYELTGDRKYYDRCLEYLDYYEKSLDAYAKYLMFFPYRVTALRSLYDVSRDAEVRRRVGDVFLRNYADYEKGRRKGRIPSKPKECYGFLYELRPTAEHARLLEQNLRNLERLLSGDIGWGDGKMLGNMNDYGYMNALCYNLYLAQQINRNKVLPPRIEPRGGTFENEVTVRLSCETPDADIRYTRDGSEPGPRSELYREPIVLQKSLELRAAGLREGMTPKAIRDEQFAIDTVPFDRTGLLMWFRADRGVERTGDVVTVWRDQSGRGCHARQRKENLRPRFVPSAANGLPVVRANGDAWLILDRLAPLRGDCTIAFVAAFAAGSGSVIGDGDDAWISVHDLKKGEFSIGFSAGDAVPVLLSRPVSAGRFNLWTVTRRNNVVTVRKNGEVASRRKPRPSDGTTLHVWYLLTRRTVRHGLFKGDLAEILGFDQALTEEELERVESYLVDKYVLRSRQ